MGKQLDDGVSALLADLKASGQLDETLVVMMGEFGRTVGQIYGAGGRDHYPQQSVIFAGAGVRGGRAIGSTDATGGELRPITAGRGGAISSRKTSRRLSIRPWAINWTNVRYDDPFGRGFEYVPFSDQDLYGPIDELWS